MKYDERLHEKLEKIQKSLNMLVFTFESVYTHIYIYTKALLTGRNLCRF